LLLKLSQRRCTSKKILLKPEHSREGRWLLYLKAAGGICGFSSMPSCHGSLGVSKSPLLNEAASEPLGVAGLLCSSIAGGAGWDTDAFESDRFRAPPSAELDAESK
jgi:hypothetical protein